jgi:hypothetical protein
VARSRIPSPLDRRHLLERQLDSGRALAVAEDYLAEGRAVEAIAFLAKAGASERLEALAQEAVEAGDFFLLRAVCAAVGRDASGDEWRRLGERAEAAGKLRYAQLARRQTDQADGGKGPKGLKGED